MATYTLTTGNDAPGQTAGDDVYDGAVIGSTGGTDTLDGGAGDDTFRIKGGSAGTITGGANSDTVEIYGASLGTTTFNSVELLDLVSSNKLTAAVEQLNSFSSIVSSAAPNSRLELTLTGVGDIDFSTKLSSGYSVNVRWEGDGEVTGTANADYLRGWYSYGSSTFNGGAGADEIHTGGFGDRVVNGGDDGDFIYVENGGSAATINGDGGDDFIYIGGSSARFDQIYGTITGGAGTDTVTVYGPITYVSFGSVEVLNLPTGSLNATAAQINSFSSIVNSSAPNSQIRFNLTGAGGTIDFSSKMSGGYSVSVYNSSAAGTGVTSGYNVTGTNNADSLNGSSYAEVLSGGGGADFISGRGGDDTLNGGAGADEIHTNFYYYYGYTGPESVTVNGGDDADKIHIESSGTATINGDGGDDTIYNYIAQTGTITGGAGTDTLSQIGTSLGGLTFNSMEILSFTSSFLTATAAQLNSFSSIVGPTSPSPQLTFHLTGAGGTVDFSTKVTGSYSVRVENGGVTAGYNVTGTNNADYLAGSGYVDTLNGGAGGDTYVMVNAGSTITEAAGSGGGVDTVRAYVSYTLSANVENITAFAAGLSITGNDLANRLEDFATGAGTTMAGGFGNDNYYVHNSGSVLTEAAGAAGGMDTVYTYVDFDLSTRGANFEYIFAKAGGLKIGGNALNNLLYDSDTGAATTMAGAAGNDIYYVRNGSSLVTEEAGAAGGTDAVYAYASFDLSTRGANVENIYANAAGLTLTGNGLGNNIYDFAAATGAGTTMIGGAGNEFYFVRNSNSTITEAAGPAGGADTVYAYRSFDLSTRGANVENIFASAAGLSITGNGLANRLDDFATGAGTTMAGGANNDLYSVRNSASTITEAANGGTDTVYAYKSFDLSTRGANVENIFAFAGGLALTGNGLNNNLYDSAAGAGTTMAGAAGNDVYFVRNSASTITEAANGGKDTAYAYASFDLNTRGANVENILAVAAGVSITGNGQNNYLYDFAASGSTMAGAEGNDIYYVRNGDSLITEAAGTAGGTDTVYATTSFDLGTRGTNVETIYANAAGLTLTGNALDNYLYDFAASGSTLAGGAGNDVYSVRNSASTITEAVGAAGGADTVYAFTSFSLGTRGANVETIYAAAGGLSITGNELGNRLYDFAAGGGTAMTGGAGNDSYYVRNANSTITELAGGGTDTVYAYTDFNLGIRGANVENILANATGLTITGNDLGNGLYDFVTGGGTAMAGGAGNDSYYVRNANSTITEVADSGGGTDTVYASIDFNLGTRGAYVEVLRSNATNGLALTGNDLGNLIVGGTGGDTLGGRLGLDTLTGNAGADTFVFDTAAVAANFDTLTDFSHADDTISLSKAVFAGLTGTAGGGFDPAQFHAVLSGAAYEADDRIVYQTDTGRLYYDADGYGAGTADAVQIALLANRPQNVDAGDFLLIA